MLKDRTIGTDSGGTLKHSRFSFLYFLERPWSTTQEPRNTQLALED